MTDTQKPKNSSLSRRTFIQTASGAAVGAGVASTPGNANAAQEQPSVREVGAPSPLVDRHAMHVDVAVMGGGLSGVCAAIAAARNGARVVLVQDRSVLGGNASSEVRMHIVGADHHGNRQETEAREGGIIEELRLEEAVINPQRSAPMFDLVMYEWVIREPNITLMLNAHCHGVIMDSENRIRAALVSRHSTEDEFTVYADQFIDCTGDGRLGAEAGAHFRHGREARSEYGEELAQPQADDMTLGSSILFITRKHDRPMPFRSPAWAHKLPEGGLPHRGMGSWEYGYWWCEWGGELDIIKDNERIRDELLASAMGIWDHIKNSGRFPQSENWALDWVGAIPGKRESRRFLGDHVLTQQEVQAGETFDDGVAFGGWPIDLHPPAGIWTDEPPFLSIRVPIYNIPFGCIYSRNIRNLLFAGRNISASHVAFGSTRVMATCAVLGQAAGTAAALCVRHQCDPRVLRREAIAELQQTLIKDDANIVGVANSDPYDIARQASAWASSFMPGWHQPDNVINGWSRGYYEYRNKWSSSPEAEMPQWIDLIFDSPRRIREAHVTFDTGLKRQLCLSHSDHHTSRMVRGPQPECVRDYEIQAFDGENYKTLVRVEGNYQRKRIHRFNAETVKGVRLVAYATNGASTANVYEIRAYA